MSRIIRAMLSKYPQFFAAKCIAQDMTFIGGESRQNQSEVARKILWRAYSKHFRDIRKPTTLRLTLCEAEAFPTFRSVPKWGGTVWLVMVSDSKGLTGYGLAQEWSERVDRLIRENEAKARAQFLACDVTIGNHALRNAESAGCA